ncbi:Uncharacterized protein BM_BM1148 [Brugia malayi]|uniref:Bm1148, isoform a n=1 Tax=Brugia malayi TaxID=6279 RepID=A0A0J9Y715_BRUMA|nr:Uncharacterized protein BM_BM1148 [Brugia malayi]CDQ03361.1 Bm1148, isoform b [Brugia malayi]VIO90040.1 Uncharacterized protein BM_BM1148 [Brugia malayi]
MFTVPNCQPAKELYGSLEVKLHTNVGDLEASRILEQRLQLLGIKNSVLQEKVDVKTSSESNNSNKQITLLMNSFEPIIFAQKIRTYEETKVRKCSIRLWLWHQYLSRNGNCSLCDRPLNGLHEDVIMLTCAHAMHPECVQEMRQNRNGCQKCEFNSTKINNWQKRKRKDKKKKYLC